MRDGFTQKTKDLLANRVGWRCSNPNCRQATRAAAIDESEIINIGVAAHITAASRGGPRYDENMSPEERKSVFNGIWLCQSCSKLIDSDAIRYSVYKLKQWKEIAEQLAVLDLEESHRDYIAEDKRNIKFFIQCFDRPAFQHPIRQEGRMEDFDQAIQDTIIALNTGVLRARDGQILQRANGKALITNPVWREQLDTIGDMLVALRRRLKIAKETGAYSVWGEGEVSYLFHDKELGEWFDYTREEILKIVSSICTDVGLPEIHFDRKKRYW